MQVPTSLFLRTPPTERLAWQRYGVALAAVFVGWIARESLTGLIGSTTLPFTFFFLAVTIAAAYGGMRAGVLSAAVSTVVANWLFFDAQHSLFQRNPYAVLATAAFLVSSLFIVLGIDAMQRAQSSLLKENRERRQAEKVSAQGQELLATTLASIGDGVIVTGTDGRITFMNAEAERTTGWTGPEAAGRPLGDVFRILDEITRQPAENPFERVLESGTIVGLKNPTLLIAKDGREIPIGESAAPIRTGNSSPLGVVLVFRDVSDQRLADSARIRLAAIVESSQDAIVTKNLNGIVQSWNGGAQRMLGYRPEEIIGKPITLIIPPERLDEEAEILADLRSGQPHHRVETVRIAKDGTPRHVSLSVSPLKDATGRVIGASKIIHDISDILAAREALVREREMLLTTLKSIGDGVIVTDAESVVTFINPEGERLTGWSQAEATGLPLTSVFRIVNEETRKKTESPVQKALRSGMVVGLANHTLLIAKDGSERPIDDSAAPILHSAGKILGVVLVFRDFTKRRAAEEAIKNSEAALYEEVRRKDEFLAVLSHELRNPLAPIRIATTLLDGVGPLQAEQKKLRDIIDRQTNLLTRLLDDLLDVSRITRGKILLKKKPMDIRTAVSSALESVRPQIDSRRHKLTVNMAKEPLYVEGDAVRLSQVFTNLLNNASKYTDPGGNLSVALMREDSNAVVRIVDSGIGLSPQHISQIFEMFAQGDESFGRGESGLGVGLALAKMLAELHGGSIQALSEGLGRGSEFIVRIPLSPNPVVTQAEEGTDQTSRQPQRRILVADDNVDSVETTAALLRAAGHDVLTAGDGIAAVEKWEAFHPEILILDIGMPGLSGYEVAERIRSREKSHTVLMAVTGWGQESDKLRAKEAGFDHHMTKPIDPEAMLKMVAALAK